MVLDVSGGFGREKTKDRKEEKRAQKSTRSLLPRVLFIQETTRLSPFAFVSWHANLPIRNSESLAVPWQNPGRFPGSLLGVTFPPPKWRFGGSGFPERTRYSTLFCPRRFAGDTGRKSAGAAVVLPSPLPLLAYSATGLGPFRKGTPWRPSSPPLPLPSLLSAPTICNTLTLTPHSTFTQVK